MIPVQKVIVFRIRFYLSKYVYDKPKEKNGNWDLKRLD